MVKKQIQNKVLILFITLSFFLSIASISLNNLQRNNPVLIKDHKTLEMALPDLPYWAIRQNATEIYRLFESINFTINSFNLGPGDADHATMQIDLSNGSTKFLDMNFIGNNKFRAEYNPNYNAPLGFQNVSFLVYNATNQLLNSHRTYTNFTILTNYMVNLNNSMYYIGDTVYGELLVSNFQIYDFTWNTTIVDSLDELIQNETKIFDRNIYQFSVLLKNETFRKNRFYYVQLNMTDKNTERKETAYFPFYVRNNKPLINGSIRLSPEEVFRTEDFTISFNVTDIESKSEDLVPWMYIYDAEGELVIQNRIAFDSNNLFSETFNIPANRPIGKYRVNITLRDPHGAFSSKITYLNVKNNAPEIHSYKINGLNMNKTISIFYGRNLVFTFNVSDIEGLAYIEVALLNENDEWFNITKVYTGENTEIIFRTFDLVDGIWFVYIYVTDSDGAVISLTDDYSKAPQGIRIIPDVVSIYLPWILIFGGICLGILLGIVATYSYFKSKMEPQISTPKIKEISPKKPVIKKKGKKAPIKEESEKKEVEELKPEKEKEEMPQRKIKRKL